MNQYVMAFSSFYKAVYAQEKLREAGILSTLKKIPPDLLRTCGYALYLKCASIHQVTEDLRRYQINIQGIFQIEMESGQNRYRAIS